MRRILPVVSFVFLILASGFAQNSVYYSRDAKLQITGEYQGKLLIAKTKALNVVLDYETTEIILRFPLSSLSTNFDSLNKLLKFNPTQIVFKGKLGLDYVNPQLQHPVNFNVEGLLTIKNLRTVIDGKGELHHVDDVGEVSNMLGIVWHLDLDQLSIDLGIQDLASEFEVAVTQAVLRRDKN